MWAVETRGLSKAYGSVNRLVDCDLQVPPGSVFGLLGPNGAGKTTLLRTLLGFLKPTRGTATIAGYDIVRQAAHVRRHVSYLPGEARLSRNQRGSDLLELFAGLHPNGSSSRARQVAARLELDLSRRVMFMSTGMRQKLALSIVLGCAAPVVVLDEPTANLDPNVRGEVVDLIRQARRRGQTVLLSSHIFSDVDDACDQVVVMQEGRIVLEQPMDQLEQLHIVRVQLVSPAMGGETTDRPAAVDTPVELSSACRATIESLAELNFVEFVRLVDSGPSDGMPCWTVEMHLRGAPQQWLGWLADLRIEDQPVEDVRIERAGIRAIYQRVHGS